MTFTNMDQAERWIPAPDSPQAAAISFIKNDCIGEPLDPALRVTLNFHPDGLGAATPVLKSLADGFYHSQFQTGTSSGSLTAHRGGDRWNWESSLFGGAYDRVAPIERPKYGALNDHESPFGGSPRFGSSHLRLRPAVTERCTFCYPDSFYKPKHFGVADRMPLLRVLELDRGATGFDPLDLYVEAHVHGPLRILIDVEALVLDPSFRGTEIEDLARMLPCPIEWHPGLELTAERLVEHTDYRSTEAIALGLALSQEGPLNAFRLGNAARENRYDSATLKHLWHYVACFGHPMSHRHDGNSKRDHSVDRRDADGAT